MFQEPSLPNGVHTEGSVRGLHEEAGCQRPPHQTPEVWQNTVGATGHKSPGRPEQAPTPPIPREPGRHSTEKGELQVAPFPSKSDTAMVAKPQHRAPSPGDGFSCVPLIRCWLFFVLVCWSQAQGQPRAGVLPSGDRAFVSARCKERAPSGSFPLHSIFPPDGTL